MTTQGKNDVSKLGEQPIRSLLWSMALPLITANIVSALYNIVDGIYAAQMSETALAATVLVYPAQLFMQSVASGTAVGVNSLLSRRLGAQRSEEANFVATHGLMLALIGYVVFLLIGLFGSGPFIGLFTEDSELYTLSVQYMTIVLTGSIGVFLTYSMNGLLAVTGRTGLCMAISSTGGILNIALAPVLIFGMFGLPALGIIGAGLAAVASQLCSAALGIFFNRRFNHAVHVELRGFSPAGGTIAEIYKVGVPSILMQSMGSVMNVGMNKILISEGESAISVFGVYYKMQNFVYMPLFGITQAQTVIVGYNFGAQKPQRMRAVIRTALIAGIVITGLGTAVVHLFPEWVLGLFSAGPEMLGIGVHALRVCSMPFLLSGICIVLGDALTGMGIGYVSAVNSFIRQILVLLPLAYVLLYRFGLSAMWYAFVVSELASVTCTVVMFRRIWRRKVAPMEAAE